MISFREQFFSILEGKKPENMLFVPDITDWYVAQRTLQGMPAKSGPGTFIPDDSPIHKAPGPMPKKYRDFTLMDFYREFNWGCHFHIEDWYKTSYDGGVSITSEGNEQKKVFTISTPIGKLHSTSLLSAYGWSKHDHYVKEIKDLDIMQYVIEHTHYEPIYKNVQTIMDQVGEQGQGDIVISRSPFGKLVHEYMGFDSVIYAMFDHLDRMCEFMKVQEKKDLELIDLSLDTPERLIILSDHADETLISPDQWRDYCIPYYQKISKKIHQRGKFLSTHLDGNFKGFFPYLKDSGFDLLDGCTPYPMFNYTIEELAEAMPEGQYCFIGVPSSLLCQNLPTSKLLKFADKIMEAFKGRAVINIGDIVSPNADIEQVIALGNHVKSYWS